MYSTEDLLIGHALSVDEVSTFTSASVGVWTDIVQKKIYSAFIQCLKNP